MAPKAKAAKEQTSPAEVEAVLAALRGKGILQEVPEAEKEAAQPAPAKKPKKASKKATEPAKSSADVTPAATEAPEEAEDKTKPSSGKEQGPFYDEDLMVNIARDNFAGVWKKVQEIKPEATLEHHGGRAWPTAC